MSFALPGSRPNVIIHLMDDWPYEMWPSLDGSAAIDANYTALLPSIAREFGNDGVHIETFYSQPMSAPSRRSLFSGRYMTQVGRPYGGINSLSTRITTLGERLRAANYSTGFFGKWFLGYASRSAQPVGRGFQSSVGFHLQSLDQWGYHAVELGRYKTSRGEAIYDLFINDTVVTREHPCIRAGIGKIRYHRADYPGGRLAMYEAGDPHGRLAAQAADEEGRGAWMQAPVPLTSSDALRLHTSDVRAYPIAMCVQSSPKSSSTTSCAALLNSHRSPSSESCRRERCGCTPPASMHGIASRSSALWVVGHASRLRLSDASTHVVRNGRQKTHGHGCAVHAQVHEPVDSRHIHRVRTLAARGRQLSAASRCPWYPAWAVMSMPDLCSDDARDLRFEREVWIVRLSHAMPCCPTHASSTCPHDSSCWRMRRAPRRQWPSQWTKGWAGSSTY